MILPREPGLQRRLAYSYYIRNRHRLRYNNYNDTRDIYSTFGNVFSSMQIYPSNTTNIDINTGLSIEKLRSVSKINIELDSFFCPICQDNTTNTKAISRTLACHHTFHITCIETWLSNNTTCPMCRLDLLTI